MVPYLELVIGCMWVVYGLHTYLDLRQYKALKLPHAPPQLSHLSDDKAYKAAQAYNLDKW